MDTPAKYDDRKRAAWPLVFLAIFICLTFSPLLASDFTLWDDPSTVWQNPSITPINPTTLRENLSSTADAIYMPLTRLAWMFVASVSRQPPDWMGSILSPVLFHFSNIAVHIAAALLVFRLALQLNFSTIASLFAAALFAVHPIQVEAVGWVSGLKDVLAGALALASMNAYVAAMTLSEARRCRQQYAGCVVAFVLALLAKPTVLILPLLVLCIDILALRRSWRSTLRATSPLFVIALGAALLTKVFQPAIVTPPVAIHLRPLVAADAMMFYVRKILWPIELGIDYGRTPRIVLNERFLWLAAAEVVALAAIVSLAWRRRWRLEVLGLTLFALALSPMLGWVQFEFQYYSTVADHYAYLAMFGVALFFAALIDRLPKKIAASLAVVIIGALCTHSHFQTCAWRDTESLMRHALQVNPRSVVAHRLLGNDRELRAAWLASQSDREAARASQTQALDEYEAALALDPADVRSLDDAATLGWRLHQTYASDPPATLRYERLAFDHWRRLDALVDTMPASLRTNFDALPARLGKLALDLGDYSAGIVYFERVLARNPDDTNARAGLSICRARQRPVTTRSTAP